MIGDPQNSLAARQRPLKRIRQAACSPLRFGGRHLLYFCFKAKLFQTSHRIPIRFAEKPLRTRRPLR
jgi:hypothetical protein